MLLAASGSASGASREIFRLASPYQWTLIATPYVVEAVRRNLPNFPANANADWNRLRGDLLLLDDVFTVDRPAVFAPSKDRPILYSALAWADVLLTWDRGDFESLLGNEFCGLPGSWLACAFLESAKSPTSLQRARAIRETAPILVHLREHPRLDGDVERHGS